MASQARRITRWKRSNIDLLFKRSRRVYSSPELDIRLAPAQEEEGGKLLFIVPRASGTAPQRNTFKRRIKALFYEEKLYTRSYDWIIFGKKSGLTLSFDVLKNIFGHIQERYMHSSTN